MHSLNRLLLGLGMNMFALFLVTQILEGGVTYTGGWVFFLVAGLTIGFLNALVKPLIKFLAIPLIFFTGGLFLIIINALILWMTDRLLELFDFTNIDLQIDGAVNFVLAALLFGFSNAFAHWFLKRSR